MKEMKAERVETELTVGEVAARSGLAVSTIHFYESKGLISSWRNSGNQRRFNRGVLRRVSIIKVAQLLGLSLSSIQTALSVLPKDRAPAPSDWKKLSKNWRDDLNERIHKLTILRDQLDGCIGCGCLSMKDCPLRNPGDRLSIDGSGPRLLNSRG